MAMALAVCTALGACKKSGNNASSLDTNTAGATATAPSSLDTTAAGGAVASDTAAGGWSDADVLAWLTAANNGEISEGKLAERKATNPAVKSFARRMVTDHTQMLKEGNALAKKLKVDPNTSTKDDVKDLMKDNQDAVQDLSKKTGKDFDEDYMEKQVDDHQKVVDKLNDLSGKTQNAQLKALMQKALPKVQSHLNSAKDIKDNRLQS
ncbi:MAG TPA: DUF4142 domain-containing protein [Gemmatimonadaceae bacterium]